jgi:hypothetical protein
VLFDLQSPRRRRVVRVVFGGLALVFAISFVAFGVGTGGSGFSLGDLFGGGGGGSSSTAFDSDIKAAQAKLATNPNDPTTLANLVRLQYSAANASAGSNGAPTSDSEQHLREGADAWNKYAKASGSQPSAATAIYALNTFDQLGTIDFQKARTDTSTADALTDIQGAISDWKAAGQAQQILIANRPSQANANTYGRLASYLYLSGQTQAADQAAAQAKGGSKGSAGSSSSVDSQLKPIQQLGQQLQSAIKQLQKQQQKTQGATGGAGGNPLGGISPSGGLGGAGTGGL